MSFVRVMTLLFLLGLWPAAVAGLTVHEIELKNGIRVLLVERPGAPLVAAGWSARVGSGDETPGATGISHLLEHMMFRGTRTIGTKDGALELELMQRLEAPAKPGRKAQRRRQELQDELRALRIPGESALIYNRAGALGIDALTHRDFTLYDLRIPASQIEVWFWMESDRLAAPVFRELGNEAEVVLQEERQRTATEVAQIRGRFEAAYWQHLYGADHPYSWSTGGRASDVLSLGRVELREHFDEYYRGSDLTMVLVGDLEVEALRALAKKYFERLPPGVPHETSSRAPAEKVETLEFSEPCFCADQVELRFATVPFSHEDRVVLDVVAALFNGRTGRLAPLVDAGATSASARHNALRQAGSFSLFAASDGGLTLEELDARLRRELTELAEAPVGEDELDAVRNQLAASAWRQLRSPSALARRLLVYDALGAWTFVRDDPERMREVSAEDVQRVARRFLASDPAARAVIRHVEGGR
ncbi:MAG: pitrilysin family protein [Acidobacteriota bacterium]